MGRGVSIHFIRFYNAFDCFVTSSGWLLLFLNNSYKWFDRCQRCRRLQSSEKDTFVSFPRFESVHVSISSLPLFPNKNKYTKIKTRRATGPRPHLDAGSHRDAGRASAGLRLHNAIFPAKVCRASGVSGCGNRPNRVRAGGFYPSLPGRTVSSRAQGWPKTSAAWRYRACLRRVAHPGWLLWDTGGISAGFV